MTTWRLGLAVSLIFALGGVAQGAAPGPADELRSQIDHLFVILADSSKTPNDRRLAVRSLVDEAVDFTETARRALGGHWDERRPEERAEFTRLFTELLQRGYLSRVETSQAHKVEILGDTVEGDQAVVAAKVTTGETDQIPVEFRMVRGETGRWRVYDVAVGGISLLANYRTQFNKIIRSSSFDDLLTRLRAKQAALGQHESNEPATSASKQE